MDFDSLVDDSQSPTPQGSPNPMPTPPPSATPAPTPAPEDKPMMFDDLKEDTQPSSGMKFDDLKDDSEQQEKYGTTGQQILTGVEGAAQGVLGPLATAGEIGLSKLGVEGLSAEDIKGREQANPLIHVASEAAGFGGSLLVGTGEARLAAKAGELAGEKVVSAIGSRALNHAVQSGIFQAGNEIEKGLTGQGDPEHPYAAAILNTGIAAVLGGLFGGGAAALTKGAPLIANNISKIQKVDELTDGLGWATIVPKNQMAKFLSDRPDMPTMTKLGIKLHSYLEDKAIEHTVGAVLGAMIPPDLVPGMKDHPTIARIVDSLAGAWVGERVAPIVNKNLNAFVFKVLSKGRPEEFGPALKWGLSALKGARIMDRGVSSVFDYGTAKAVDYTDPAHEIESLRKYIDEGGVNAHLPDETQPMAYADGGEVSNGLASGISNVLPEQNMMLNATKARVSNFLTSHKPMPLNTKKAFDGEHIDPESEHKYERLLHLAVRPVSILNHVKDGSLLPQHVLALKAMYPEIHNQLGKKMLSEIANKVHEDKKPPYHVRQSLSLFLGSSLDSTLTPQNIQAAQMVFMKQNQAMKPSGKPMKGAAQSAQTPDQGRTDRLNKG